MSQQIAGRRRSKRLAAYEEEDGDFVFTRGSKRTKISPPSPEPALVAANNPPTKAREKQSIGRDGESEVLAKKTRGRKMEVATTKAENDSIKVSKRGTRRGTRLSGENAPNGQAIYHTPRIEATELDSIDMVGVQGANKPSNCINDVGKQFTIISLPFSDTPVINRNKELRKEGAGGARRSSLGMRGRRASSLIDNGYSAIPHKEVETSEFYKHIEADGLSEPRRMKQLLTWVGERALGDKKVAHGYPDSGAILAARVIQESLLKDFGNKPEFSDWFSREDSAPTKIIKKPNPRNIEIQESITEIEARVKWLQKEKQEWISLLKPQPPLVPLLKNSSSTLDIPSIDSSLLDPEQAAIFSALSSGKPALDVRKDVMDELKDIYSTLEFKIDEFADGVHKVEQFQGVATRVADKILAMSAVRLEERERKEKEKVGTRDVPMQEVLRSLSRILPEGSSAGGS